MKQILGLIALFIMAHASFAGVERTVTSVNGADINTSLSLQVRDQYYPDLVAGGGTVSGFKIASSSISAVLRYDLSAYPTYSDFNLDVYYTIELRDTTGSATTLSGQHLGIEFDENGATQTSYTDQDIIRYDYYVSGKITGIDSITFRDLSGTDISTDIPNDVFLDLVSETYRYYTLNQSKQLAIYKNTSEVSSSNQLRIGWEYTQGAESYDLEWTFVDIPSNQGTISSNTSAYAFQNATRINTTQNFYYISMGYPRGAIIYRVRPVGVDVTNRQFQRRIEGNWSYTPTTYQVNNAFTDGYAYAYDGLDTSLNWTYNVGYAEDGKRKELIKYFDGSSRSRQNVTVLNTDTNAVVAETMYDHQGRPAVQVLPTPVKSSGIGFYTNGSYTFNKNYDKDDFATDQRLNTGYTAGGGYTGVLGMDSTQCKTSEYYSEQNSFNLQGRDFIPDAENYPFSQTTFKNDGTNRVKTKSVPGKKFQTGGGYTTHYLYGRPTQPELDRLFGNEVGYAGHYEKNYVIDPNGQATVQYLDQEGRIIATALAGPTPPNLDTLYNRNDTAQLTVNLLDNNNYVVGNQVQSSYVITVLGANRSYTFDYLLEGTTSCDSCRTTPHCDSCQYDLVITMKDEDGGYVSDTSNTDINPTNYTFTNLTQSQLNDIKFTAILSEGTYTISKTLTMNTDYRDSVAQNFKDFLSNLDSLSLQSCVSWNKDNPDCNFSCDSVCYRSYRGVNASGQTIWYYASGDSSYVGTTPPSIIQSSIDSCLQQCNAQDSAGFLDDCQLRYEAMSIHMSPGGQYFENTPDKYLYNADGSYQVDTNGYRVLNGSYNWKGWLESNVGTTPPSYMYSTWDSVRTYFQSAWADSLVVNYHPEYCIYKYYCLDDLYYLEETFINFGTLTSDDRRGYDEKMFESQSTAWASNNSYGYNFLNPFALNDTAADCSKADRSNYINESTQTQDPFFGASTHLLGVTTGPSSAVYMDTDSLKIFMQNFMEHKQDTFFSIWYLLDDPCNIAGGNSGSRTYSGPTLSSSTQGVFDVFHGSNSRDPGMIGDSTGQVTKFSFFRSAYTFYKQWMIYDHFDRYSYAYIDTATCNCTDTVYTYWNDDNNYDGILDTSKFELIYPRNSVFDNFTPYDTSSINQFARQQADTACDQYCEASATSWILQIQDSCLTQYNKLTSAQKDSLKSKLIQICKLGCDSSDIGSSLGNQVDSIATDGPYGVTYAHNFDEVIQDYIDPDSCVVTVNHPDTTFDLSNCTCDSLKSYASGYITNMDNDYPRWSSLDSLAQKMNTDWGYSYDSTDVHRWYKFCNSGLGDIEDIPAELECVNCKCGNLSDYLTSNFPDFDLTSLTTVQKDSIVESIADLIYPDTVTWDSVNVWMTQCDASSPKGGRFKDLPDFFKCAVELEGQQDPYQIMIDECEAAVDTLAYQNAYNSFIELVEDEVKNWKRDYDYNCYDSITTREELNTTYTIDEYYYTLYYYDQAGNLIKTVPPKGVNPIIRSTLLDSINGYRLDSLAQTVFTHPDHSYISRNMYDTYNNLRWGDTPDGNETDFWYDLKGRLVVSQNARQAAWSNSVDTFYYSYTMYDDLSRIIEVGQALADNQFQDRTAKDSALLATWFADPNLVKSQVTKTFYDAAINSVVDGYFTNGQENVRARVASITYEETDDGYDTTYNHATHYSYDIHGNVQELYHENTYLSITAPGEQLKNVQYEYDIVSGNVNKVIYQESRPDQFMHRYSYDADNRITNVETSKDGIVWEDDAKYLYYMHGPLYRTEVGEQQVQATDMAYTAQGWLKVENANTLRSNRDMGQDGLAGCNNVHRMFAEDAMGFSLGYYEKDYSPVDNSRTTAANSGDYYLASMYTDGGGNSSYLSNTNALYNGNISQMVTALLDNSQNEIAVHGNSYTYDQANRLVQSNVYTQYDSTNATDSIAVYNSFKNASDNGAYRTSYTYDLNGNILYLNRNRQYNYVTGAALKMDSLTYSYASKDFGHTEDKNTLMHIDDVDGATAGVGDLDDQGTFNSSNILTGNNYEYDDIGQLIKDSLEGIDTIIWNVYGKVTEIQYSDASQDNIEFLYDASQNRIAKITKPQQAGGVKDEEYWTKYWYTRDAQGNILSVYKQTFTAGTGNSFTSTMDQLEKTIYGSKRLGVDNDSVTKTTTFNATYTSGRFVDAGGRNVISVGSASQTNVFTPTIGKIYPSSGTGTVVFQPEKSSILTSDATITVNDGKYTYNETGGGVAQYIIDAGTAVNVSVSDTLRVETDGSWGLKTDQTTVIVSQKAIGATNIRNLGRTRSLKRTRGYKQYELSNHLGSVLATISDRKNAVDGTSIMNDAFGSGTDSWSGSSATVAAVSGQLEVTLTGTGGGAYKGATVDSSKIYFASVDIDPNGNPEYVIIQLLQQNPSSATPIAADTIKDGSVKTITFEFCAPTDSLVFKVWLLDGTSTEVFYMDNAIIEEQVFTAEVLNYSDFFPFGMVQPGRSGSGTPGFIYSYQGSEKDDEIYGTGNSFTTTFRQGDPRVVVWWSNDPRCGEQAWLSPFNFMNSNPILFNDPMGDKIKSKRNYKHREGEEPSKEDIASYEEKMVKSLSEKTGLNLSFNKEGELIYEKDENGVAVVRKGTYSEDARKDLIKGIDDEKFLYEIGWAKNAAGIRGAESSIRKVDDVQGYVIMDLEDFSDNPDKSFDIGMVFLHEYNHGYFGLRDDQKAPVPAGNGKPEFYKGTGLFDLGSPGKTVTRVNTYRDQLNLAQRRTYAAIGNKVLFSKTYTYKNKRGKVKKRTTYFWLPSFD